jgi:hypothetical protein
MAFFLPQRSQSTQRGGQLEFIDPLNSFVLSVCSVISVVEKIDTELLLLRRTQSTHREGHF